MSSPYPPPYTCHTVSTCHLSLQSSCVAVDATTLTCLVPPTNANSGQIQYSLVLDDAPFPDISDIELLQLSSSPNPSGFILIDTSVSLEVDTATVRITVRIFHMQLITYDILPPFSNSHLHTYIRIYPHISHSPSIGHEPRVCTSRRNQSYSRRCCM